MSASETTPMDEGNKERPEIITLSDDDEVWINSDGDGSLDQQPARKRSRTDGDRSSSRPNVSRNDSESTSDGYSASGQSSEPDSTAESRISLSSDSSPSPVRPTVRQSSQESKDPIDRSKKNGLSLGARELSSGMQSPTSSKSRNERSDTDGLASEIKLSEESTYARYYFLNPTRMIFMKIRAYHLLKDRGIEPRAPTSANEIENTLKFTSEAFSLNFFPDATLNGLMEKILFMDSELDQVVQATILVFWYEFELESRVIPLTYPFSDDIKGQIVPGCDIFFKFWDAVFDFSSSLHRKAELERAIRIFVSKTDAQKRTNGSSQ